MNQSTNQPNTSALSAQNATQPESWRAFGQNRSLFVPVANNAVQAYALNFFISSKWQHIAIWLATRLGLGRKVSEDAGEEWAEISDTLALAKSVLTTENAINVNTEQVYYAIRQGSKGPYQKTSLIAVQKNGQPLFYAKVAAGAAADAMVDAESTTLQRLSLIDSLKSMVPQRLSFGKTPSGRAFFTTTVATTLKTNNRFESQHENFLSTLGHATVQWGQYANSAEPQFAESALKRLKHVLGDASHLELTSAVHEIMVEIGDLNLPTVLAHRDFAPWNIRWHQSGIFVFDWEYAADGANPLYDFFHFHLMQRVLSRWCLITLTPAYILPLTALALKHLQQTFPEVDWSLKIVKCLLLSYVVNLIFLYVDSGKKYDPAHPVLSEYYNFIMNRKQWF